MRLADVAAAHENGRSNFTSFYKRGVGATANGIWQDFAMCPGNPVPQYYFSTPMTSATLSRSVDGGIDHGPDVPAGYTKYLQRMMMHVVAANPLPLTCDFLDYLMYYPGISMDPGSQDLINTVSLPRQTEGYEGSGVHIMVIEQNPYSGSATFFLTYTNENGVSGRITPTVTCNSTAISGVIATTQRATNGCPGRFMPLQSGDRGVRSIEQIEFIVGDTGLVALVLVKPICKFSVLALDSPCEVDFLQEYGWMPQIPNDAFMAWIGKMPGSFNTQVFNGDITTIWSNS